MGTPFASALDLAYWGYLHLKKGQLNDKPVLPSGLFGMAAEVQSPILPDHTLQQHGFLWYVKDRESSSSGSEIADEVLPKSFQIIGITGALLLVIPEHDIVVVRMYNKLYNYGGLENDLFYLREFGIKLMACLNRTAG